MTDAFITDFWGSVETREIPIALVPEAGLGTPVTIRGESGAVIWEGTVTAIGYDGLLTVTRTGPATASDPPAL